MNVRIYRRLMVLLATLACCLFLGCSFLDHLLVKVIPIRLGNSSGGETTVYFKDTNHDELILSTNGKRSDVWDTNSNIAIFYKPVFFKISGDTLHIMCEKPDCFNPQYTNANIFYYWREGNPLCYEKQARADGYKIIHSLWTIDEYNQ